MRSVLDRPSRRSDPAAQRRLATVAPRAGWLTVRRVVDLGRIKSMGCRASMVSALPVRGMCPAHR